MIDVAGGRADDGGAVVDDGAFVPHPLKIVTSANDTNPAIRHARAVLRPEVTGSSVVQTVIALCLIRSFISSYRPVT
jgi:hypothetical protein